MNAEQNIKEINIYDLKNIENKENFLFQSDKNLNEKTKNMRIMMQQRNETIK